jgi:hypothetical protein
MNIKYLHTHIPVTKTINIFSSLKKRFNISKESNIGIMLLKNVLNQNCFQYKVYKLDSGVCWFTNV